MKMIRLAAIAVLAFSSFVAVAQKSFEGKVKMKIEYTKLPAGAEQMRDMLPSDMFFYLKDSKMKMEQDMGMGGSQVVIFDQESNSGFMLLDMMGQKMLVDMSNEDLESINKQRGEPKIEYVDGEEKEIAGYTCKKALVTMPGSDVQSTVYYTNKLPAQKMGNIPGLEGFAMEYTVNEPNAGMEMVVTAVSVEKSKVSSSEFDQPDESEGYTKMSMNDLQQMGMGG